MKIFALLAAGATVIAAPAAAEVYSFKQDGVVYHVEESVRDGVRLIKGSDSRGAKFAYEVRGNRVNGVYNGSPVDFKVAGAKTQRLALR